MADPNPNQNASDLRNTLRDVLFEQRNIAEEARNFAKQLDYSSIEANAVAKAFRDIESATRNINAEMQDILSGEKGMEDLAKKVEKHRSAEKFLLIEAEQSLNKMSGFQSDITQSLSSSASLYQAMEDNIDSLSIKELQLLQLYAEQLALIEEQNQVFGILSERAKVIEDSIGIIPKLGDAFSKILGSKASSVLGLDKAFLESRKLAAELTKGGREGIKFAGKAQIAGKFLQSVSANILKSLGPIGLIVAAVKALVEGYKQADISITNIAKSFAITKDAARDIYSNMGAVAASTGDINITTEKLAKSFSDLNSQLGFLSNVTGNTLVEFSRLTELVGLSAQETTGLVMLSEARGVSLREEEKSILGAAYGLMQQSKIQFDLKEILKEVSTISGRIRANLQANGAEMAKAVVLAKELGGNLNDVSSISKSLLSFETSIAAELEAEVLTGRQLNLEKARLAALNGDIVGLEREIASELGTFTEFSKMNVIQQEALAKAFGLSSDILADMLFKQQVMGRNEQELRAAGEEELANMIQQQTMQEKFNNAVLKLKGIFSDLAPAIMPFVELLGFALSIVSQLSAVVMDIIAMFRGDFDFSSTREVGDKIIDNYFNPNSSSSPSSTGNRGIVSDSRRNSASSMNNEKRMLELLETIAAKDPALYMNDEKLNNAAKTSGTAYSVGSRR